MSRVSELGRGTMVCVVCMHAVQKKKKLNIAEVFNCLGGGFKGFKHAKRQCGSFQEPPQNRHNMLLELPRMLLFSLKKSVLF